MEITVYVGIQARFLEVNMPKEVNAENLPCNS